MEISEFIKVKFKRFLIIIMEKAFRGINSKAPRWHVMTFYAGHVKVSKRDEERRRNSFGTIGILMHGYRSDPRRWNLESLIMTWWWRCVVVGGTMEWQQE